MPACLPLTCWRGLRHAKKKGKALLSLSLSWRRCRKKFPEFRGMRSRVFYSSAFALKRAFFTALHFFILRETEWESNEIGCPAKRESESCCPALVIARHWKECAEIRMKGNVLHADGFADKSLQWVAIYGSWSEYHSSVNTVFFYFVVKQTCCFMGWHLQIWQIILKTCVVRDPGVKPEWNNYVRSCICRLGSFFSSELLCNNKIFWVKCVTQRFFDATSKKK